MSVPGSGRAYVLPLLEFLAAVLGVSLVRFGEWMTYLGLPKVQMLNC
jgi:hypothetical protein